MRQTLYCVGICLALISKCTEAATRRRHPPSVNVTQILDLGDVRAVGVQNYVARDLGFSGKIGSTIINVYGDTCNANATAFPSGRQDWNLGGFAANSVAIGDPTTPLIVSQQASQIQNIAYSKNFNYTVPRQFCQYFPNETPSHSYGMGITSIQDVDGTHGLLFFLKLWRPGNGTLWMMGGGIAKVDNSIPGSPTCNRIGQSYWNGQTMPWYGTYGTLSQHGTDKDGNSYIYAYGQANSTNWGNGIFLARVPKKTPFKYKAFTYWNGTGWQSKPLFQPQASQAIMEYLPSPTIPSTSSMPTTTTTSTSFTSTSTASTPPFPTSSSTPLSESSTSSSSTSTPSTSLTSSPTSSSSLASSISSASSFSMASPTTSALSLPTTPTTLTTVILPSTPVGTDQTTTNVTGVIATSPSGSPPIASSSSATVATIGAGAMQSSSSSSASINSSSSSSMSTSTSASASASNFTSASSVTATSSGSTTTPLPSSVTGGGTGPGNTTSVGNTTSPTTRPLLQSGQGSLYWSPYHKAYLMFEAVNTNIFAPANGIQVRSALAPEGPWTQPTKIVSFNQTVPSIDGGSINIPIGIYSPAVQPWYDTTGKTVMLTFTYDASVQRVLKLTFA